MVRCAGLGIWGAWVRFLFVGSYSYRSFCKDWIWRDGARFSLRGGVVAGGS